MTDILLIQPPIRDFYLTAKRTIPYGLACIAASLIRQGFSTAIFDGLATSKSRIIDLPRELEYTREYYGVPDVSPFSLFYHFRHFGYSFEYIGKIARESGAFLVGISSLFTAYSDEALETAEIVRKFHPKCRIVLGGHHPTAMPDKVMECRAVDFAIRGEGEVSMPLLAEKIRSLTHEIADSDLDSVPGLVFRKTDGRLCVPEPVAMKGLDDQPLPAMHLVKHSFYKRKKRGSAVIVASRGCPMKCSYCSLGAGELPYRRRSVESVLREIKIAVTRYHAGFIDFEDENLSLEKEWFMRLLREIKRRFGDAAIELRAMNGLFPPSLDEEMIRLMKEAGFRALNLSLGSTSRDQLRRFRRPDVREAVERIITLAGKYDLETVCYVIAGAPGQRAEDSLSDILWLARRRAIAGVSVFYPSPGSEDFELSAKLGILPDHFSMMRSAALPVSHTTTRLESVTLLRLGRILNFMKLLVSQKIPIPAPAPFSEDDFRNVHDRIEVGIRLLACFLYDVRVRGITPEGDIVEHKASTELTEKFIRGLKNGT
ncbi:radical SAM protein [Desulfococcaceae bacterium HSG8]|nr:radical SAM protein [Desulfococcaceae bacterium HSG8]